MMYHISDSATGYILQFSIYTGKNTKTTTKDKVPLGAKVVLELTLDLEVWLHLITFFPVFI